MKFFDDSKYHKHEIVTLVLSVVIIGAIFVPYPGVNASHVEIDQNSALHGYGTGSAIITLNPSSGAIGTSVSVTGLNFIPLHPVVTKFDGHPITKPSSIKTDNNGVLAVSFTVPESVAGPHTVTVSDGTNTASATFTVTTHAHTHKDATDDHNKNDNKSNDDRNNTDKKSK
jgi:hypothetical protein